MKNMASALRLVATRFPQGGLPMPESRQFFLHFCLEVACFGAFIALVLVHGPICECIRSENCHLKS